MDAFELPLTREQYTRLNHLNDNLIVAFDSDVEQEIDKAHAATRGQVSIICNQHGRELLASYVYSFSRLRGGKGILHVADKQPQPLV